MKSLKTTEYIGIDAIALPSHFSGAAYYIYYLTLHLLAHSRSFPLAIYCKPQHCSLFNKFLTPMDKIIPVPAKNRAEQLLYYEYHLQPSLLTEKVRLFYSTHYICPPPHPDYSIINTFHDLGFKLFPQYYPLIKRLYFGFRLKTFLFRSDHIVAVSRSTANAIQNYYPQYPPENISVIYPGTDHLLSLTHSSVPTPYKDNPYILAINTIEKRKNVPFLIRVFNHLKKHYQLPHELVLIGNKANGFVETQQEVEDSAYRSQIHLKKYLPEAHLNYFYQHSNFFINASRYEGFGFTPFEAIQHSRPTFLYQNNTVEEILGNHHYIFNHFSETEWAEKISRAYQENFPERIERDKISHLTWRETAQQTLKLFEKFMERMNYKC